MFVLIRPKAMRHVQRSFLYLLAIIAAAVFFLPLVWMVSTSLKPVLQTFEIPPRLLPSRPRWLNYEEIFTTSSFLRNIANSFLIATVTTFGFMFSSALVGYGFGRLRFPGRNLLFMIVLATLMIPEQVTLIPTFIIFRYLGWIDSYKPLIVPSFFGWPFFIFLCRQFFLTITLEMEDAARMDGCGTFNCFLRIMLPLAKPVLATVAIFCFMWQWNDYLKPLIYLNSSDLFTVPLGLAMLMGQYHGQWNLIMAGSVLSVLPGLILFLAAQRYFIQGVVVTGVR